MLKRQAYRDAFFIGINAFTGIDIEKREVGKNFTETLANHRFDALRRDRPVNEERHVATDRRLAGERAVPPAATRLHSVRVEFEDVHAARQFQHVLDFGMQATEAAHRGVVDQHHGGLPRMQHGVSRTSKPD